MRKKGLKKDIISENPDIANAVVGKYLTAREMAISRSVSKNWCSIFTWVQQETAGIDFKAKYSLRYLSCIGHFPIDMRDEDQLRAYILDRNTMIFILGQNNTKKFYLYSVLHEHISFLDEVEKYFKVTVGLTDNGEMYCVRSFLQSSVIDFWDIRSHLEPKKLR